MGAEPDVRSAVDAEAVGDRPMLGELLARIGWRILRTVTMPPAADQVTVTGARIFDRTSPPEVEAGQVVLAVGVDPSDEEVGELTRVVASRGAAAVVLRSVTQEDAAARSAEQAGVTLLSLPADVTWDRALAMLDTAIAASTVSIARGRMGVAGLGDLFSLANAIAMAVGGAVVIEDPHAVALAYSTVEGQRIDEIRQEVILARKELDDFQDVIREDHRRLWRSSGVVRFDGHDDVLPRLAVLVRAGPEVLGQIWVVEGDIPLDHEAEHILKEAARLTALHLLHIRAAEDLERERRAELFRSLLDGTGSVRVATTELGLPVTDNCAVMAFRLPGSDEPARHVRQARLIDAISFLCETIHRQAACVQADGAIYALFPISGPGQSDRLIGLARKIAETADGWLGVSPRIGIGSVVALGDARRSREEADRVLRVLDADRELPSVAAIDDVRVRTIVSELSELLAGSTLDQGPLTALLRHDAKRNVLVPTLRAYLDAFGDVPRAAALVGVHVNTFRYRLRGVLEHVNLDDPDERLVVQLQFRLLEMGE